MISPEDRAKLDQACALLADTFPSMWKRLYDNLITEGFNEKQAIEILFTVITAQVSNVNN